MVGDASDFGELEVEAVGCFFLLGDDEGADFSGGAFEESEDDAVVNGDLPDSFFAHGLFLFGLEFEFFGGEFDDFLFAPASFCHFLASFFAILLAIEKFQLIKSHALCQLSALQQCFRTLLKFTINKP